MAKESKIETKVSKFARDLGCHVRKFKSPANRGVQDRLFQTPENVIFFIEFKAPGKEPTALQLREQKLVQKNKGFSFICDDMEDGKRIVLMMLKLQPNYSEK